MRQALQAKRRRVAVARALSMPEGAREHCETSKARYMHILITGSSRGIGAELTRQYQDAGAEVTGTTRQTMDVTDPAAITAFAESLGNKPIDLLVCNAGVFLDRNDAFETGYAAQTWADTFAANVTGVFLTVQAFLPNVKAAKGKIAIISSQMGSSQRAKGNGLIYRASKAAASNLGFNLAVELAPVPVGIYHPGWVSTDMGGAAADVTPEASAAGLIARFEALSAASSGEFLTFDGEIMPA